MSAFQRGRLEVALPAVGSANRSWPAPGFGVGISSRGGGPSVLGDCDSAHDGSLFDASRCHAEGRALAAFRASSLATIPKFLWELSLGIYCTVNGFRPYGITALNTRERVEGTPAPSPA